MATRGDIRVDGQGRPPATDPAATVLDYQVDTEGRVLVHLSDGTEFTRGQVLLQKFRETFVLRAVGEGLYANVVAAGPLPQAGGPGTQGLGRIESGALEIAPEPETLALPSREGFRIVVSGEPGARWTLQTTTDFLSWTPVGIVTNAPDQAEFTAAASGSGRRAYRVLVE